MRRALDEGRVTSRELVRQSLIRIALYEERLNATIAVNPKALELADALDRERAQGKVRGPLHGIPIALKDNIHTTDMPTTGGALAFEGFTPPYEATLTTRLRDAGAIILAKTVLTELANWVAGGPTPMPANYSALAGFGLNPYDPRRDPRAETDDGRPVLSTGGSSSGIGTSASFWAANVGTETSGSILSPSNQTMLVGIKPTVGRVSRYGVIPITADQDTPGPMARTVTDAAILLGALEGTTPDPHDPATKACTPPPNADYTPHLKRDGLEGARIGIPRAFFFDRLERPGEDSAAGGRGADPARGGGAAAADTPTSGSRTTNDRARRDRAASDRRSRDSASTDRAGRGGARRGETAAAAADRTPAYRRGPRGGLNDAQRQVMADAIAVLVREGAVIVDPADIPSVIDPDPARNFLAWRTCSGVDGAKGKDEGCSVVFKYGMKRDFNAWIATLGPRPPVASLTALRTFNMAHASRVAIKYGQSNLDISDDMNVEKDRARYEADRAKDLALAGTHGIEAVMKAQRLDALLFPGASGAAIAAKPGYPTVIVPFGTVPNAPTPGFPEGFDAKPTPFGVSFTGLGCSEPRLIELAYAFEQATKRRLPPPNLP